VVKERLPEVARGVEGGLVRAQQQAVVALRLGGGWGKESRHVAWQPGRNATTQQGEGLQVKVVKEVGACGGGRRNGVPCLGTEGPASTPHENVPHLS
jgi:hypothetical protein